MKTRLIGRVGIFLTAVLLLAARPVYAQELSPPLNAQMVRDRLAKSIFLDLRDINVVDVFKFLAVQGSLNIVTSKNVQGRSTLVLKNVTIGDALDIIVISNELAYEIKGGIIFIMTEDEYNQIYGKSYNDKRKVLTRTLEYVKPSYVVTALQAVQSALGKIIVDEDSGTVVMIDTKEKLLQMNALLDQLEKGLDTKVFELQHATAKEIETQMKPYIDGKGVGSIFGDSRSNQLVVSAYPERMKQILPLLNALDKKNKAVLIEVRILQLTLNPHFDSGINWERLFKRWSDLDLQSSFPIDTNISSADDIGTVGKLAVGVLDDENFEIEIKAMKEIQNSKTLANPRLMIMNREEAKINIGDRIPYVITTSTGSGNNVSVSEDIRFIDTGVILSVTPVISDNGFITMKIRPEISSQTGTLVTPTNNQIPIVNKTYVQSSVIVKDGVTIVLGGLRRDDFTEGNRGVPYMADIPVLGHLFKSRNESLSKTEIVILITPHIVDGDKDVVDQPLEIKSDLDTRGRLRANVFDPARIKAPSVELASGKAPEDRGWKIPFFPFFSKDKAVKPGTET